MLKFISNLNKFDRTVRQKLTKFDEKLNKIERNVDYYEVFKISNLSSDSQ